MLPTLVLNSWAQAPTLASQSVVLIGMSHRAWPQVAFEQHMSSMVLSLKKFNLVTFYDLLVSDIKLNSEILKSFQILLTGCLQCTRHYTIKVLGFKNCRVLFAFRNRKMHDSMKVHCKTRIKCISTNMWDAPAEYIIVPGECSRFFKKIKK